MFFLHFYIRYNNTATWDKSANTLGKESEFNEIIFLKRSRRFVSFFAIFQNRLKMSAAPKKNNNLTVLESLY